jgi:hypothetical protein
MRVLSTAMLAAVLLAFGSGSAPAQKRATLTPKEFHRATTTPFNPIHHPNNKVVIKTANKGKAGFETGGIAGPAGDPTPDQLMGHKPAPKQ